MRAFALITCALQVKDANRVSGEGRTTCPFFEELDAILGTRAASSPAVLLESGVQEEGNNYEFQCPLVVVFMHFVVLLDGDGGGIICKSIALVDSLAKGNATVITCIVLIT